MRSEDIELLTGQMTMIDRNRSSLILFHLIWRYARVLQPPTDRFLLPRIEVIPRMVGYT